MAVYLSKIDLAGCIGATITHGTRFPDAIGCKCPSCGHRVSLRLSGYQHASSRAHSITTACPHCAGISAVILVFAEIQGAELRQPVEAYISPGYEKEFEHPVYESDIPTPLRKAVHSAIDAYNAGIFAASAVAGRRALEGVFKYLVPEEMRHRSLAVLIDEVNKQKNFGETLTLLSHSIRRGGSLGAHFDSENEPDEKMAREILELLTYLISFLYVLPKKIKSLEDHVSVGEPADQP